MSIYLDYAATTPIDNRVHKIMEPYLTNLFYNPSSPYLAAKNIRNAIDQSRSKIAHWLGVKPVEIIFTAGATESINIAIHGIMQKFPNSKIAVSGIEHPAVLNTAKLYPNIILPVLPTGSIDTDKIKYKIDDQTVLISVGYANNEIGTIQKLKDISNSIKQILEDRRKRKINLPLYLHTDASQAADYLDLHVSRLGVDLMTLNGGKVYGPKQTGILYIKAGIELRSFITGGGQELGLRSGTENVSGIIGLAAAIDIAQSERNQSVVKESQLRDQLQDKLTNNFPEAKINGNLKKRLPNNLHISFPGIDGERLVMLLDEKGLQAATGSACAASKQTASHVLKAIDLNQDYIQGSLRLTLGRMTTAEEIKQAADLIISSVKSISN